MTAEERRLLPLAEIAYRTYWAGLPMKATPFKKLSPEHKERWVKVVAAVLAPAEVAA